MYSHKLARVIQLIILLKINQAAIELLLIFPFIFSLRKKVIFISSIPEGNISITILGLESISNVILSSIVNFIAMTILELFNTNKQVNCQQIYK